MNGEYDNRVQETLIQGMRDYQNLLVHLQTVLQQLDIPTVRAGGGLTFSGFSIQIKPGSPVDWIGYHIDRPDCLVYQIQDRILPKPCRLSDVKRLQSRQYERTLKLTVESFFLRDEESQMDRIASFLTETIQFLNDLPPEDNDSPPEPFIPTIDRDE